jgi:type IV pilus assembly protein PilB
MAVRLGELLLREKRISAAQLQEALTHQRSNGGRLGSSLVKLGFVKDDDISAVLSRQYGVPAITLNQFTLDPAVVRLVPAETAIKYHVIPVSRSGTTLTLAMTDPTNVFAMDDIKFMTGLHVEPVVASENAIRDGIDKYYAKSAQVNGTAASDIVSRALEDLGPAPDQLEVLGEAQEIDAAALEKESGEAPIVRLVNALLLSAIQRGASDIHVEPYEKEMRVRFRIDGVLQPVMSPSLKFKDPITSRLKIMARLDIAEKRLPQDGRIKTRFNDHGKLREIDFRVSCLPCLFGEKIVLRILDSDGLRLDMTKLGFQPKALERFESNIRKPWGMVLVTGPTGSGKTNTLYS